ncbi:MAG: hypothetical protein IRY83_16775, partial [Chloroflexi bacterium]|nr:hypothetical protein [Chloroflexota bacterium]
MHRGLRGRGRWGLGLRILLALALALSVAGGVGGVARADAPGYQLSTLYVWPSEQMFATLAYHEGTLYVVSSVRDQVSIAQVDAAGNLQPLAAVPVPGAASGPAPAPLYVGNAVLGWDSKDQMWVALEVHQATATPQPENGVIYAGRVGSDLQQVSPGMLDALNNFWTQGSELYLQLEAPTGRPNEFESVNFAFTSKGWSRTDVPTQYLSFQGSSVGWAKDGATTYVLGLRSPDGTLVRRKPQPSDLVEAFRVDSNGNATSLGKLGPYGGDQWELALAGGHLVALHYNEQQPQATLFQQTATGWSQTSFDFSSVAQGAHFENWLIYPFVGLSDGNLAAVVQAFSSNAQPGLYVAILTPGSGATTPKVVQVDASQLLGAAPGGGAPGAGGGSASFQ